MNMELRHIGIVIHDLEKCIEFWEKFFDFKIMVDQIEPSPYIDELLNINVKNLRTVKLKGKNNVLVELLKFEDLDSNNKWTGNITSIGLTHIALTVNNIEELFSRLKESGYDSLSKILIPPRKNVKVVFVKGPENLILELVQENLAN